jgi:hypothetical protein
MDYPIFEGAFMVKEDTYHVKASQTYQRVKRSDDADLHHGYDTKNNVHMVVYRDSDTVQHKRDELTTAGSCGFDNLPYNTHTLDQHQPVPPSLMAMPAQQRYDIYNGIDHGVMMGSLTKRAPPTGCPTSKKSKWTPVDTF